MPENINISPLSAASEVDKAFDDRPVMVKVDHVSMVFNMADAQLNSLKEYAIAIARRELMFKEFRALDGISFEVRKGDVFGILGTNGSGKSTMLKIIAGVLEPSEGTCVVRGKMAPLIELGAGFDMELTARENIYLNGALLGYPRKFVSQHFDEIVEFAEIKQFLDMPMKNYSSGMVARIAFAIATVIVPEVLIVDEVLSVGDFMFQQKCERRITELIKEHNVTVLIVSHNNDQIERLCNKAIWIEKGRTRMIGNAKDVCDTYRVLGGHAGSPEAEKRVFAALLDPIKPNRDCYGSIAADSRYGMAAKFAGLCFEGTAQTVVLVSGDRNMECLVSTGLAGALDAPVLLIQEDYIPDSTAQELKRLNPDEIVLINSGDLPEVRVSEMLEQYVGGAYRITCLEAPSYPELSHLIFEYGLERSLWSDSVIVTYVGCVTDLVTLSPYTYGQRCPILLQEQSLDCFSKLNVNDIERAGFKTIFVLGDERGFPDIAFESFRLRGARVVRFCGKDVFDANALINDWLTREYLKSDEINELLIAAAWNAPDAFAAPVYAAKNNCLILLEDPQNLDSVACAIAYIEGKKGSIKKVTFIGDRIRFNDMDKMLLAKIVVRAKKDQTC